MNDEQIDAALRWLTSVVNEQKDRRAENPYPHIDDDNWLDDEHLKVIGTALAMQREGVLYNISNKDDYDANRDDWKTLPELIAIAKKQQSVTITVCEREEKWQGICKLVEEQGELLQVIGKLMAFPDGQHPDGQGDLTQRLEDELADVGAALQYFIDQNKLDQVIMLTRAKMKQALFENWQLTGVK